jgi:ribosome-associated toxin RatA of RatAB toxin-antitoxin module
LRCILITKVFASHEISGICRKKNAWQHLIDIRNFPERIPDINVIRIIEKNDHSMLSEWFICLDGAPFSWIEYDTFIPERYTFNFKAISGDFDIYRGYWKITDSGSGTLTLASEVEYTLGIPVIEQNLGNVLKEKMQHFLNVSVKEQCNYLNADSHDERREERVIINHPVSIRLDGRNADANIINLSSGGMMFRLMKGMFEADEKKERTIDILDHSLKGYMHASPEQSVHRLLFSDTLSSAVIRQLCQYCSADNELSDSAILFCDVMKGRPVNVHQKDLSGDDSRR